MMEKNNGRLDQIVLINDILNEFNSSDINYVLLRNYEFLCGDQMPVESLDTTISKNDLNKVRDIFERHGFIERRQQFSLKHKAFFKLTKSLKVVSFDIQTGGIHWNDMVYLGEEVLKNKIKESNFYKLSDNDNLVMLLVHSILGKRYFKKKYQKIIMDLIFSKKINEEYIHNKLSKIFGFKNSDKLLNTIKDNQFEKINNYSLIASFLFRKPTRITTLSALTLRWIKQRQNPFKLCSLISIVGPDGAGKSSAVEVIREYLTSEGRKVVINYSGRGRNHLLPITAIGRRYKQLEKQKDKKTSQTENRRKTFDGLKRKIIYTAFSLVITTDLLLRYWLKILPQRARKRIVVTDRYGTDVILMKNVPFSIKKILCCIFPKPSISFYLYNYPEILHQRRPEESIMELKRQMEIFERINYSLKLRTDNSARSNQQIISTVYSHLLYNWY